jgi:lipopolysaccharide biosynthesis glycosyltransferase
LKNLIILGTDLNYIKHIKYNIGNIRDKHGDTDICILFNQSEHEQIEKELRDFTVILKPVKALINKHFKRVYNLKYHIFDTYFKNWENILYLDCDTMVYANLDSLFNLLSPEYPLYVDYEDYKVIEAFSKWCPENSENAPIYHELKKEINAENTCFNAGIILYHSSIIAEESLEKLYQLDKKYESINKHVEDGSDQPIINLLVNHLARQVPANYFSFWRNFNENSLISHFCRWEAPWQNNSFNPKIGTTYIDYYNKCLRPFLMSG